MHSWSPLPYPTYSSIWPRWALIGKSSSPSKELPRISEIAPFYRCGIIVCLLWANPTRCAHQPEDWLRQSERTLRITSYIIEDFEMPHFIKAFENLLITYRNSSMSLGNWLLVLIDEYAVKVRCMFREGSRILGFGYFGNWGDYVNDWLCWWFLFAGLWYSILSSLRNRCRLETADGEDEEYEIW